MSALHEYIKARSEKTPGEWAKCFRISRPYLYALADGSRQPSIEVASRIAAATDGAVPVTAWPKLAEIVRAANEGAA